ncbi:speckle targeted PIP5K1A-regulated poly(A) polymerase, partial [Nephila pilipes]
KYSDVFVKGFMIDTLDSKMIEIDERDISNKSVEAYLPRLAAHSTISKKMKHLWKMSHLSEYDNSCRKLICQHIHKLLLPYYPECKIEMFGSSVNGFGTRGCDLDLMFSPCPDFQYEDIKDDLVLPSLNAIKKSPALQANIKYMGRKKQLRFILRVLRSHPKEINSAIFVNARCPIIKFVAIFNGYKVPCDMSFHHRLALYNTKLLHFLGTIDPRVQPLMITLRFWAKCLNYIGCGHLSSYCFTLLVIFFLQNIENPILPSVDLLMKDAESVIEEGWEVGFTCDPSKFPPSKNKKNLDELLKEFFNFYWNFNFYELIICIRTGKVQRIKNFICSDDETHKRFRVRDICAQDPFDLTYNVGGSASLKGLTLFKPSLYFAYQILCKNLQDDETDTPFQLLFKKAFYKTTFDRNMPFTHMDTEQYLYMFPDYKTLAPLGDAIPVHLWYEFIPDTILNILKYIFFFDAEVIDKNLCDEPPETESKFIRKPSLLMRIQCAVDVMIWNYRNANKDDDLDEFYDNDFKNPVLRRENALSHFFLKSFPALHSPEPIFWFNCNIYKSPYPQCPYILITFNPSESSRQAFSALKALRRKIPVFLKDMYEDSNLFKHPFYE